jgi:hypothetical protein
MMKRLPRKAAGAPWAKTLGCWPDVDMACAGRDETGFRATGQLALRAREAIHTPAL